MLYLYIQLRHRGQCIGDICDGGGGGRGVEVLGGLWRRGSGGRDDDIAK